MWSIGSLPSRERGLKSQQFHQWESECWVAPLAGAWIEILSGRKNANLLMSLPSRERGLKYYPRKNLQKSNLVAPLAGAWIEIIFPGDLGKSNPCRSPRGSVD